MDVQIFGQLTEDLILVRKFSFKVCSVVLALLLVHLLHVRGPESSGGDAL